MHRANIERELHATAGFFIFAPLPCVRPNLQKSRHQLNYRYEIHTVLVSLKKSCAGRAGWARAAVGGWLAGCVVSERESSTWQLASGGCFMAVRRGPASFTGTCWLVVLGSLFAVPTTAHLEAPAAPPLRRRALQTATVSCGGTLTYQAAADLGCSHIEGDLLILNTDQTTLEGLSGLQRINGSLSIAFNNALTGLSGLDSLASIGSLSIVKNDALADMSLPSLSHVLGDVYLRDNLALTNYSGLCGGVSVDGDVEIHMPAHSFFNLNWCFYTSVFNDSSLAYAVGIWCASPANAEALYGPIRHWDVSRVTSMTGLFLGCHPPKDTEWSLGLWDVSAVTNMKVIGASMHTARRPLAFPTPCHAKILSRKSIPRATRTCLKSRS